MTCRFTRRSRITNDHAPFAGLDQQIVLPSALWLDIADVCHTGQLVSAQLGHQGQLPPFAFQIFVLLQLAGIEPGRRHQLDRLVAGKSPLLDIGDEQLAVFKKTTDRYADQLPAAWTSIYALTQMPADDFERCIAEGYRLCDLSTAEIDTLVKKTRKINNLMSPFKEDKKALGYCVAKVFFTKPMDDTDLRLLQKAFDEIAARLPVKLRIEKQVEEMHKERALQRYEALKQEAPDTAVKPETWDYGTAANNVYVKDAA